MKEEYCRTGSADGELWIYYIDSYFAWFPRYCQGTLCWFQTVWFTWPEFNGKPITFTYPDGKVRPMYEVYYPYDPRKKTEGEKNA